jgi:putative flippase GtrA
MSPIRKKDIVHFVKFAVVGAANFCLDFLILTLLSKGLTWPFVFHGLGWPVALANTISYTCGIINSFILNRYWTFNIRLRFFDCYAVKPGRLFKNGARIRFFSVPFLKFIFVNLVSLGVNTLTMFILVDLYQLSSLPAKIIATGFSFVVNFAGSKLLVFRDSDTNKARGESN